MKTALAIFVKTPGVSPVKTRLANSIGKEAAESFFRACIKTVEKTALKVFSLSNGSIQPYWAVGEEECLSRNIWENLPRIYTGPGDLGSRLYKVYKTLLEKNNSVLLIGADSPQITAQLIISSNSLVLSGKRFIIGPAADGGFYLFGGKYPISKNIWTRVNYSTRETMDHLVQNIRVLGEVTTLETLVDVDEVNDLHTLANELKKTGIKLQLKLAEWMKTRLIEEKNIIEFTC